MRDFSVHEYEIETARELMRLGVGRAILNPRRIEDDEIGDHALVHEPPIMKVKSARR